MAGRRTSWLVISVVLSTAFAVRMSAAIAWQRRLPDAQAFVMPDSHSYLLLARHIARGEPYEHGGRDFRIFRAPAYPLLIAGVYRIAGDDVPLLWLRATGAVLGTLTVGGVMWLAHCMFDDLQQLVAGGPTPQLAAWIAGILAACYPGAIAMSILVLAEALFCPLMLLHLIGWVRATRPVVSARSAITWSLVGGVAAGLAVLTRPSWMLFTPFVLVLLTVFSRERRRHLVTGGVMLAALCLTMMPWWVRNYRAVGRFVPTTLQVGASLYDGWNPDATGGSNMAFAGPEYDAQKAEDAEAGRSACGFEVRLDQRLRAAATAWALNHPDQVLRLAGRKFIRMWNVWPNADDFRNWIVRWVVVLGYVPLLVLGLAGAWRWRRAGWPLVLCLLPALYFTCLHMIFVSSIRYRQPAMLVLLVLAAGLLAVGVERMRSATAADRPLEAAT